MVLVVLEEHHADLPTRIPDIAERKAQFQPGGEGTPRRDRDRQRGGDSWYRSLEWPSVLRAASGGQIAAGYGMDHGRSRRGVQGLFSHEATSHCNIQASGEDGLNPRNRCHGAPLAATSSPSSPTSTWTMPRRNQSGFRWMETTSSCRSSRARPTEGARFLRGLDIPQGASSFGAERPVGVVPELRVVTCPTISL